jgi:hypothetical protein
MLSDVVTTFSADFKGTPSGRARWPAPAPALSMGVDHLRGSEVSSGRSAAWGEGEGALAAVGRQPGPLPLGRR